MTRPITLSVFGNAAWAFMYAFLQIIVITTITEAEEEAN